MAASAIIQPVNSEEREFCRHILDMVEIGEKSRRARYSSFLTEREQQLAVYCAESQRADYSLWGGYEDAVRKVFSTPSSDLEEFPLKAVTFSFRRQDKLFHRDFLGALMSLGIKRDQIGDIAVSEGRAVIFVISNVSSLVYDEINKVGRVGVKAEWGVNAEIPKQEFEELNVVVSSVRLDAMVSAVCGASREKAADLIKSGKVILNGVGILSSSKMIDQGDTFSVKGYGKYIFSDLGNETKKGKNHIIIKKYK